VTGHRDVILECQRLYKQFGGVVAVDSIDLAIVRGQILAVIGDNGAGKSTLIKMLCGAMKPDAGKILYEGKQVTFAGPLDARMRGIETVYQDLALIPTMDVAQNLFLGREMVRRPWGIPTRVLKRRAMVKSTATHLSELSVSVPAVKGLSVDRLSGGQRQGIAIARALTWESGVLIMDEPTAALGVRQSETVLTLAKRVADRGSAVLLISHSLPHVMNFADRIVVLFQGKTVADMTASDATPEDLVSLMVGQDASKSVSKIVESQQVPERGDVKVDEAE
jgi:fructose transport system ATP-binding protein